MYAAARESNYHNNMRPFANFGHAAWTDFEYLVRNVRSAKEKKFAGILLGDYHAAPTCEEVGDLTVRTEGGIGEPRPAAGRPYGQDRGRDRRTSPRAARPSPCVSEQAGRSYVGDPRPASQADHTVGPGAGSGEPHRARDLRASALREPPRGRSDVLVGLDSPGVQWYATNPPSRCRPTMSRSALAPLEPSEAHTAESTGATSSSSVVGPQDAADAAWPSAGRQRADSRHPGTGAGLALPSPVL